MAEEGLIQFAAPVLGMHGGISDVNMPDGYCRLLYNMVPDGIGLYTRRPWSAAAVTGVTHIPYWLHSYTIGTANGLFYVTTTGRSIRVLESGSSSSATMLSTSATVLESIGFHFNSLYIYTRYTGSGPRQYDGTTESSLSITRPGSGDWNTLTDADVTGGHPFKSRAYYWSLKTNEIVYTAVNAAGGTLTSFPLERVSQTGGNVKLITSLTMDGGNGPDDLLVICLDTGETLIYQGSDPGNSADWSIIGRFYLPPPIAAHSVCKMGGDALLLTRRGLVPVQQYVKAAFGRVDVDWLAAINPMMEAVIGRLDAGIFKAVPFYSPSTNQLFVTLFGAEASDTICLAMNVSTGGWWINRIGNDSGIDATKTFENANILPYAGQLSGSPVGAGFMAFAEHYERCYSSIYTSVSAAYVASYGLFAGNTNINDLNGETAAAAIGQEILHDWKIAGPAFKSQEARVNVRVFDNESSISMASPLLTVYRDFRPDFTATLTLNTAAPYTVTGGLGIEGHAVSARVTFTSKNRGRFRPSGFMYQGTTLSAESGKL